MAALICLWSQSIEAVTINFANSEWESEIENEDHTQNRQVVLDPITSNGQVLMVDYSRSTLYGTQFDYPAFSQAEDPIEACLSYEVLFENKWAYGMSINSKIC